MIEAKVICDSIASNSPRLTTFQLRYPKFIHGEAKTHRLIRATNEGGIETMYELWQEVGFMDDPAFSRNASSSRAIPVSKNLEEVRSDELRAAPFLIQLTWHRGPPPARSYEADPMFGLYVVEYDPTVDTDGCYLLTLNSDQEDARRFASREEALEYYKQPAPNIAGRVFCPLQHNYEVRIIEVQEGDKA